MQNCSEIDIAFAFGYRAEYPGSVVQCTTALQSRLLKKQSTFGQGVEPEPRTGKNRCFSVNPNRT